MSVLPNTLNRLVGLRVTDVSDDKATMVELTLIKSGFWGSILRRQHFVWLHSCRWQIYQHGQLVLSDEIGLPLESTPWDDVSAKLHDICSKAKKLLIGRSLSRLSFQNATDSTWEFDLGVALKTIPNSTARGFNGEPGPQICITFPGRKHVDFQQDGSFTRY